MKYIKKFNEDIQQQEENDTLACIEAAKNCLDVIDSTIDKFKEKDDLQSVVKLTQCSLVCELYIYSCENNTDNLEKVIEFTKEIVIKISEDFEEVKESCLKLVEEIKKCENAYD